MKKRPDFKLEEEQFVLQVEKDIHLDEQDTQTLRSNRKKWIQLAENEPDNLNSETDTSDAKEEFDVSLPIIATTIDQLHSRRVGAIYQNKPITSQCNKKNKALYKEFDLTEPRFEGFYNFKVTPLSCPPIVNRI